MRTNAVGEIPNQRLWNIAAKQAVKLLDHGQWVTAASLRPMPATLQSALHDRLPALPLN